MLSDSEEIIEHIHGCFNNCPALREVIVPEGNPAMMSRNGAVYSKDGHTLLLFPENNGMLLQEALEGVDTLGRNAFKRCGSSLGLTDGKLTLDSLKAIGKYAFEYYEGVRELNLGGEVTETQGAFRNCPNLERVVITAPLKRLGEASFSKCPNLREIVLPDTLETIEACLSECPLLEELHIPASVQSISDSFLSKSPDTTTLVVTPGSYAEQFAAEHNLKYRSE